MTHDDNIIKLSQDKAKEIIQFIKARLGDDPEKDKKLDCGSVYILGDLGNSKYQCTEYLIGKRDTAASVTSSQSVDFTFPFYKWTVDERVFLATSLDKTVDF